MGLLTWSLCVLLSSILARIHRVLARIARRRQRARLARCTDMQLYRLIACERPASAELEVVALELVIRMRNVDRAWPYPTGDTAARRARLSKTLWLLEDVLRAQHGAETERSPSRWRRES